MTIRSLLKLLKNFPKNTEITIEDDELKVVDEKEDVYVIIGKK